MATLAIDFDGVINDPTGKKDAKGMTPPMNGARDAISLLRERGHKVYIHSCNTKRFIEGWMNYHDIRHDGICDEGKPAAFVYIDDRGLRFTSWPNALTDLDVILHE